MIEWPDRAAKALSYLFAPYNDIDVYIEDVRKKSVYSVLLNRVFEGRFRIRSVIALAGRDRVIEGCREHDPDQDRLSIFIIDSDFDLTTNKRKLNLGQLYRLPFYCVENLLVCENAIAELIFDMDKGETIEEILLALEFEAWREDVVVKLFDLFLVYSIANSVGVSSKNVSRSGLSYISGSRGNRRLDQEKVETQKKKIWGEGVSNSSEQTLNSRLVKLKSKAPITDSARLRRISGKSHLLPLLRLHLQIVFQFGDSLESMPCRLARFCNIDQGGFRSQILKLVD